MMEYLGLIAESAAIYIFLTVGLRLMGKKEFGQINVFDIVVFLMIAQLMSLSLTTDHLSLGHAIASSLTLMIADVLVSQISLKNKKLRDIFEGKPTYIIKHGKIDYEAMKKLRYNFDDLVLQTRGNSISSPSEIEFAILETNGDLSVIRKKDSIVKIPEPIILEGKIMHDALEELGYDEEWLLKSLANQGVTSIDNILLCIAEKERLFLLEK